MAIINRFNIGYAAAITLGLLTSSSAVYADYSFQQLDVLRFMNGIDRRPENIAEFRAAAVARFDSLDLDGNGYSQSDISLSDIIKAARWRSDSIAEWAKDDLDADGNVSREELEMIYGAQSRQYLEGDGFVIQPTPEQQRLALEALVGQALAQDSNGDGDLSLQEVINAAAANYRTQPAYQRATSQAGRVASGLAFDTNGDGQVPQAEFDQVVDEFMAWLDANRNGIIDPDEATILAAAYAQANRATTDIVRRDRFERERTEQAEICGRLTVPEGADIIVIGGYEGSAISSVRIGSASNITRVIDIRIQLGLKPVFLMLETRESTIWRITGHTQRVAGVGIDRDSSGIIGIPPENVQYFNSGPCELDLWIASNSRGGTEANTLSVILGRKPEVIVFGYEFDLVNIPGGPSPRDYSYPDARPALRSIAARKVEADLLRFNPGGVVDIDPAAVVAQADVAPYAALPQEAGLAELAESGAIEPTGLWLYTPIEGLRMGRDGMVLSSPASRTFRTGGGDDLVLDAGKYFRIVGGSVERSFVGERVYIVRDKIDIPIGLSGAHSVTFLLPDGVPLPRGDLGGSELLPLEE